MKVPIPLGKRLVFRSWITINGLRVYASQYGKRAFPILIDE
jgi:hypothetical protein